MSQKIEESKMLVDTALLVTVAQKKSSLGDRIVGGDFLMNKTLARHLRECRARQRGKCPCVNGNS